MERQDFPCTYLAHRESESKNIINIIISIIIIIIIILIVIIIIIIIIIIVTCSQPWLGNCRCLVKRLC